MNLKKKLLCAFFAFKQTLMLYAWRKGLCLYGIHLLKVVHPTYALPFENMYNSQVSNQK